jgi:hypothetical protein
MPQFKRYIGIDYSGAETPTSSLSGLRVYAAYTEQQPGEVAPPPSPRKYWTRRGIAEWLREQLLKPEPTIVGIDHAFSFPVQYFEMHELPFDWTSFLKDFRQHWPTHEDHTYVDFIRDEFCGDGRERAGDTCWFRLTERWTAAAKSVFRFDIQGAVAKSTHAGLPWLLYLREHCGDRIHFWPFDGWDVPTGKSAVVEVYPSLWMRRFSNDGERNGDQQAAYAVTAWLRRADLDGSLASFLRPPLEPAEQLLAQVEGWILGVS